MTDPINPAAPGAATRNLRGELPALEWEPTAVHAVEPVPVPYYVREGTGPDLWFAWHRAVEEWDRRAAQ